MRFVAFVGLMVLGCGVWQGLVGNPARPFKRRQWLVGTVLNFLTGPFDVLAEAVGRIAALPDDGQERGDEQKDNDAFG